MKMNKRITAVIAAALILINLTACSAEPKGNSPDNSSGLSVPVSDNSEDKTESSSSTESGSENSGISESNTSGNTPETGITAPDGSILDISEAVSSDYYLKFEHTYIRYAKPIFYSTIETPGLVKDWDTFEFTVDRNAVIKEPNYFKVKAGDKLENGLTVKTAAYLASPDGRTAASSVSFDGEITLEGILYCDSQDNIYYSSGHLQFFADPTKNSTIPIPCGSDFDDDVVYWFLQPADNTAFVYDGKLISFGIIDQIPIDLSGIITYGESIRAKVTIKDLRISWSDGDNRSTATPVSIEKLSD